MEPEGNGLRGSVTMVLHGLEHLRFEESNASKQIEWRC